MNNLLQLILAGVGGMALGAFFFGGLWWTLQRLPTANHAATLMLGSALVRMAVAVLGFYVCVRLGIGALLACLVGFLLVRVLLTRKLRQDKASMRQEPSHAP